MFVLRLNYYTSEEGVTPVWCASVLKKLEYLQEAASDAATHRKYEFPSDCVILLYLIIAFTLTFTGNIFMYFCRK